MIRNNNHPFAIFFFIKILNTPMAPLIYEIILVTIKKTKSYVLLLAFTRSVAHDTSVIRFEFLNTQ